MSVSHATRRAHHNNRESSELTHATPPRHASRTPWPPTRRLQEDADAVGLSLLSGAHLTLVPRVIEELAAAGRSDVLVIVGGIIPDDDIPALEAAGVAKVFTPGASSLPAIGQWLGAALDEREEALGV